MVPISKPKIPILVIFEGLEMVRLYIIRPFGIYYGHLVYLMEIYGKLVGIWIFPRFGLLCQEKSGNPGAS
jgi:hypothetical protein